MGNLARLPRVISGEVGEVTTVSSENNDLSRPWVATQISDYDGSHCLGHPREQTVPLKGSPFTLATPPHLPANASKKPQPHRAEVAS